MERIKNFFNDESGASAVEYGLLVSLIAVMLIVAMQALQGGISGAYNRAAAAMAAAGT
jgi:pilus assembly protein Flp/PilA